MDIYIALFSASVALAGFVAVILVFRYQTIDTYVDNRKSILRSLLGHQIQADPHIEVEIQEIGKHRNADDPQLFQQFNSFAVDRFVEEILEYRKRRTRIVSCGLTSITIWGILSLFYLSIIYLLHSTAFCATMTGILSSGLCKFVFGHIMVGMSIVLFGLSMIFTLCFIVFSLSLKREKRRGQQISTSAPSRLSNSEAKKLH